MSQSETWDALRLAAEWRLERPVAVHGEAPQMPDPELTWKRRTSQISAKSSCPPIVPSPVVESQVHGIARVQRTRDWLAWRNESMRSPFALDLAGFDSIFKEHYNPMEVARMAMMRIPTLFGAVDRSVRRPGYARDPLPFRRSLTAALTSLPGWAN